MAIISNVVLTIERATHADGSICTIFYSYDILCDAKEQELGIGFSVWVELWGKDLLFDDLLGDLMYDTHSVSAQHRISQNRHFVVPCDILDEDIGTDEIYLKVNATSTLGITMSALSPILRDRF